MVVVLHLPEGLGAARTVRTLRALVDDFIGQQHIEDYLLWYYTPLALAFTDHLGPAATIYDCMDELSAFKGAPAALKEYEADLMRRASLVLTGGQSLYEAKRDQHTNIHAFPSSVDVEHFARARSVTTPPADQAPIRGPRLGFFGVIDERMDLALLDRVAAARPGWQIVMLGPVVKIFTGPVDEFFDYRFGRLPYRSLDFKFETRNVPVAQPGPVVNYPNENAYTRVTEFKYLTGQEHSKTTLVYEYAKAEGDPYYPVPRPENRPSIRGGLFPRQPTASSLPRTCPTSCMPRSTC